MSDGGSAQRSARMTISKHKTDSGHREFHAVARSGAAASYQARIKAQVWRAAEESGMGLAAGHRLAELPRAAPACRWQRLRHVGKRGVNGQTHRSFRACAGDGGRALRGAGGQQSSEAARDRG